MKMAWAVFWRVFALQYLTSVVLIIAARNTQLLYDPSLTIWKPSVFWAAFATTILFGQAIPPNGLLYLLWGKQLQQNRQFWRELGICVAALFFLLSGINILVGKFASTQLWLLFKAFAPFICLAVFAGTVPAWLSARSKQATETVPSVA